MGQNVVSLERYELMLSNDADFIEIGQLDPVFKYFQNVKAYISEFKHFQRVNVYNPESVGSIVLHVVSLERSEIMLSNDTHLIDIVPMDPEL